MRYIKKTNRMTQKTIIQTASEELLVVKVELVGSFSSHRPMLSNRAININKVWVCIAVYSGSRGLFLSLFFFFPSINKKVKSAIKTTRVNIAISACWFKASSEAFIVSLLDNSRFWHIPIVFVASKPIIIRDRRVWLIILFFIVESVWFMRI